MPKTISYSDLPEFEQPIAKQQTLRPGNRPGSIAHVMPFDSKTDTNTIFADTPSLLTPKAVAHELVHQIQRQAGGEAKEVDSGGLINQKDPAQWKALYDKTYGYGGTEGLAKVPSIGTLNAEQQANIPLNYMTAMDDMLSKPVTDQTLQSADALNSAYARPMHQLASMARPGNTIDTEPQPPGPPPSVLTGMIKPLPDVGGQTLYKTIRGQQ
jgi:hypothetical protein